MFSMLHFSLFGLRCLKGVITVFCDPFSTTFSLYNTVLHYTVLDWVDFRFCLLDSQEYGV